MITLRFVPAADWPAVAAQFCDLGFEQSLTYGSAAARRIGGQVRFVVLERAGRPVAAACLRTKTVPGLGRGIVWMPSGPLVLPQDGGAPDAATLQAILAALRAQFVATEGHILRLRLSATALQDPEGVAALAAGTGFHPTPRAPAYRSSAIDLHKPAATLLADLNGKWRTDLRAAQKSGLTLERGQDAALQARFMALFDTVQTAKGFRPDVTPEFHFALTESGSGPESGPESGPDYALDILIATKDGQDVAGIVIGTSGKTTTYLFGATAVAGRQWRAGYFLTWEAIALSRARSLDWYDLGGIDADANPDVARFKERMNGTPLFSAAYEARPSGIVAPLIGALETLRARLKRR